ncbi:hypothetical protein GLW04_01635 [Halobacillus litoralis]|uniref:YcxB-like C-terminal domain-containing protein n=1 Tax=Halobacillus litoralis TaxID=45668 RepID=A0A845DNQ9_9BACI|nr:MULTISPECIES: YcxB family protein [Halobacillus]MYL18569.1 hypothetical protein [Halobacillus litoralis]MYL30423.1 hypothetical protein [Halobacillus halophilus]MYL38791.1 hypothetical protein [Halobacillus litoralis]
MNIQKGIHISGILQLNEFKQCHAFHFKRMKIWTLFSTLVLFTILFYGSVEGTWWQKGLVSMGYALIPAAFVFLIMMFVLHLRSTGVYKADYYAKNAWTYTIDDKGITEKIKKQSHCYLWKEIATLNEVSTMFVLYTKDKQTIILPKRYFASEEQQQEFKELAAHHLSKQPYKRWIPAST